ncbi:Hsp20/alpha crystallin family protein [Gottfriedia luciferensis]|uniref:Hsp20/alpha crystallin family protein n=1 Tax=Gottfriedia luciferensis TaxID=178774 RepID=UPI0013026224|nr:Hsp20/alpha crystallin family protein [Gottfriedia luciferensis]
MSEQDKNNTQDEKQTLSSIDFQHYLKKVDGLIDQSPIRNIFDEIDKFFHKHGVFSSIGVEIIENGADLIIQASMPGVNKEQIYMDLEGTNLTIGLKTDDTTEVLDDQSNYSFKKYSYSQSQRIVKLPFPINAATASATYENGLLVIKGTKLPEYQKQIFLD